MNDAVRKSISATLAEIEQSEVRKKLADVIIDGYFAPDTDALEAWQIIDRIERRLHSKQPANDDKPHEGYDVSDNGS